MMVDWRAATAIAVRRSLVRTVGRSICYCVQWTIVLLGVLLLVAGRQKWGKYSGWYGCRGFVCFLLMCCCYNDFYEVSGGITKERIKKGNVQDVLLVRLVVNSTSKTSSSLLYLVGCSLVKWSNIFGGGTRARNMTIYKVAPSAIFNWHTGSS
jgi:hypothetical protein